MPSHDLARKLLSPQEMCQSAPQIPKRRDELRRHRSCALRIRGRNRRIDNSRAATIPAEGWHSFAGVSLPAVVVYCGACERVYVVVCGGGGVGA